MNIKDKSKALAELMGGTPNSVGIWYSQHGWNPYQESISGYAQSMECLLKFPEVMCSHKFYPVGIDPYIENAKSLVDKEPTQANILDEILRMNGVEI